MQNLYYNSTPSIGKDYWTEYRIELSTARDERDIKVKELHPSEQDIQSTDKTTQHLACVIVNI